MMLETRDKLSINYLWLFYAIIFGLFQVASVIVDVSILPYVIYPIMASCFLLFFIKPADGTIISSRPGNVYLSLYSAVICFSVIPFIILVHHSIITYLVSTLAYFVPFALFPSKFNPAEFEKRVKFFIEGLFISFILCLFVILVTGDYADATTEGIRFISGLLRSSLIGRLSIFVIAFSTLKLFENPSNLIHYIFLVFGVFMLIISGSKIGIVSALVIMFIIFIIKIRKKKTYFFILIMLCLFSLLNLNHRVRDKIKFLIEYKNINPKGLKNLNGRTEIWSEVNQRVSKSVLFGYGYGSPRIILSKEYDPTLIMDIGQSHNAYLESMLNVGLLGTTFLILLIIKTFYSLYRILKVTKDENKFIYHFMMMILIYQVIRGITEASFAQASTIEVIIIFSFIIIIRNAGAIKARQPEINKYPNEYSR